jgi:3,4-dihydroxy-2-butanone 4-phosphate synthase
LPLYYVSLVLLTPLLLPLLISVLTGPLGHIFLCQENPKGLATRRGHTELSIALARAAGIVPVMVGCVMLSNEGSEYGALGPDAARAWAEQHDIPFLEGPDIAALLGFGSSSPEA